MAPYLEGTAAVSYTHLVGFGALAIATAFNLAPLAVAVPVVVVAAFLLLRL